MRIGIIGAGMISEIYLQNLTQKFDNIEVVAIASLNNDSALKKAQKYDIEACSVEKLLAKPDIEMVINLTPVGAHYSIIKEALHAGKHVYTEKTITDDSKKAMELLDLANEKGLILGCAPDTFMGSVLQAARKAIDDNLLGDIHSFTISSNRNNSVLLSLFEFLRKPGAGVLFDHGVYYVTALVSLLGPVKRTCGIVGAPYKTHINIFPTSPDFGKVMDTPNESQVSAILQLKNGITGTLHMDNDSNMIDETFFAVYGTKGILYMSDPNKFGGEIKYQPNYMDPSKPVAPVTLWKFTPYEEDFRGVGPSEMAEAIENKRPNRASGKMALHVLEVLESILLGGEEGKFTDIRSDFEMPEPLCQRTVPITNFSHITFQLKNEEEMVRFYTEVLGMKDLFTLTTIDLGAALKEQFGEGAIEPIKDLMVPGNEKPWIHYLKLADHQYLELFHSLGAQYSDLEAREQYCGYRKVNYEVNDIDVIRENLVNKGITLKEDVHITVDGSRECSVLDPDGNEIQFTEYAKGEKAFHQLTKDVRESCSLVKFTTQVALSVRDAVNMENFYCTGLGLKKAATLTYGDMAAYLAENHMADEKTLSGLMMIKDRPWIDYIEVGPHQYIELFHEMDDKKEQPDLKKHYGYQHFCLEVSDINEAWDAVTANGIQPYTQIALGAEGAYQFWMRDPDGNELELMEYTDRALQLN